MKRWWQGTVVAVLVLLASSEGWAASRIAFVDVQKVLARSVAGVAAREQLERERAGMEKDLGARRAEMDKLREEIEKKGLVLSPEAKREKEETLQRRVRDFRRLAEDMQKELERKEQLATQRMLQELTGVVERLGKEKGFLLIVEKRGAGVIYGASEADITDEIIKVYDLERSKEKK